MLAELLGHPVNVLYGDWRPGDQRIYISDIRKAQADLCWSPMVRVSEGVQRLFSWVVENRKPVQ